MPRFYFDILNSDTDHVPDDEGTECSDEGAAALEAARSLADITQDAAISGRLHAMAVHVFDEDRRPIFEASVNFRVVS